MTDATEDLSAAAKKLSPRERLALVEQLFDSLDAPDSSIDALWRAEAESRLSAYRRYGIHTFFLVNSSSYPHYRHPRA